MNINDMGHMPPGAGIGLIMPPVEEAKKEPINIYPKDDDLKLIIDCYTKIGPLPTGDRINEIVLYYDEDNDNYQVHKYASNGYGSEYHAGYYTTSEHARKAIEAVDVQAIMKSENMPLLGASRVIKFRNDNDEVVRVECSSDSARMVMTKLSQILGEAIVQENRIVPEVAKNWKKFTVIASGMSMTSCYNYNIERNSKEMVRVMGSSFIDGKKCELADWVELSQEEAKELDSIPLGLMLSTIVIEPAPMSMNRMPEMLDGNSCSCTIIYGDGRRDTKLPDYEILSVLDELMKKVFVRNN